MLATTLTFTASRASANSADSGLYTLPQLIELAQTQNAGLRAANQQVRSAEAGIETARALPNPEVEILTGSQRARLAGSIEGNTRSLSITQRLDLPPQRNARINAATAGLTAEQAQLRATQREMIRNLKLQYYELLRRQAELDAAEQDLVTSTQINERVSVRVKSGEAPRYDIIKADAELLNAQKHVQGARLRVAMARAMLRKAVGAPMASRFDVIPDSTPLPELPKLERLRQETLATNPDLARDRALAERARQQLAFERAARLPTVALRAGYDQDPEVRGARLGVTMSIPLWDRRAGPIADATAQLNRLQLEQEQREFSLQQSLEAAYQQYEISRNQVAALESGILRQSEAALRVAEAAYRFGERGILDYLDAQRFYRSARNELIAARYEVRAALIEIERLHRE
ncbi:TolC family protein [Lacisediminimonas profundi]|uniref:TolC family protein n=1 Tax=Lacisediminimonas profundi TaxID=2603856 RepID=UPI00124AF905|nr:TolC family protein [Lacisediminimonas profundi]